MSYRFQSATGTEEMQVSGTGLGILCQVLFDLGRPEAGRLADTENHQPVSPEECRAMAGALTEVPLAVVERSAGEIARALSEELGGEFDHLVEPRALAKYEAFLAKFALFCHNCGPLGGFRITA